MEEEQTRGGHVDGLGQPSGVGFNLAGEDDSAGAVEGEDHQQGPEVGVQPLSWHGRRRNCFRSHRGSEADGEKGSERGSGRTGEDSRGHGGAFHLGGTLS
jgi:hypothetical protein